MFTEKLCKKGDRPFCLCDQIKNQFGGIIEQVKPLYCRMNQF